MLRFALFGAGRIGRMHADNLVRHPKAELAYVYDVVGEAAKGCAARHGAMVASSIEQALGDSAVDAVLIASSTDTHIDLIQASVEAGKAVLCEKPIDLDIARVDACWQRIRGRDPKVMIGFNRRFDPPSRPSTTPSGPARSATSARSSSPAATPRCRPSPTCRWPAACSAT